MREDQIAFIICYNNDQYLKECLHYIRHLEIPTGKETDIVTISDAPGMCAGYNAGMKATQAKYKVYLHQDVFLLNQQFISDVMSCFAENPKLALLGVLGTDKLRRDATAWDFWTIGMTVSCDGDKIMLFRQNEKPRKGGTAYMDAEAVDGMCMVTSQDIPWREDLSDGFDYYDISQSTEFLRRGWQVGVVRQKRPWCMHDCGKSNLLQYDHYRKVFCDAYGDPFEYSGDIAISDQRRSESQLAREAADKIEALIDENNELAAQQLISGMEIIRDRNNRLNTWWHILRIINREQQKGCRMFWKPGDRSGELLARYDSLRFSLMRTENGDAEERENLLLQIREEVLSQEALEETAKTALLYPQESLVQIGYLPT